MASVESGVDTFAQRIEERRPSVAGVVLGFGVEKFGSAAGAPIDTVLVCLEVFPAESWFRTAFAEYLVLTIGEAFAPLSVGIGKGGFGIDVRIGHGRWLASGH
jgi:hypothetical protein